MSNNSNQTGTIDDIANAIIQRVHSILTADSSNNVGAAIDTINSGVVTPPSSGIGTAAPNLVFSTAPNSNESMQAPFSPRVSLVIWIVSQIKYY